MKDIYLASASPRRKLLLEQLGLELYVLRSNISEKIALGEKPEQVAMSLAFQKTIDASKGFKDGIFIGADTIVILDGEILGKPLNEKDAYEMLKKLSGKKHYVISGFCIIDVLKGLKIIDYVSTEVIFNELSDERIENYIKSDEPMDKAGAYAIQGKGALLIDRIDGCYFNVIGLPLSRLDYYLREYFDINLL